jgi:hypothetical protein
MAPGQSVAPGSFHDGAAPTSHNSAASAFNLTRATAPYLSRTATPLSTSAHSSGVGSFKVSGLPATPGTAHTPIERSVGAGTAASASGATPFGFPTVPAPNAVNVAVHNALVVAGRIPDNVHVNPPTVVPPSGQTSGNSNNGSGNGNQNYGSSPEGTLESGQLGNLLYALLGPAGTGVTPGDAGLQVTPVSPTTTTTSSPNVMVGLLILGVLAGAGYFWWRSRKKGDKGAGGEHGA